MKLHTKGQRLVFYHRTVQKAASLMVWGCIRLHAMHLEIRYQCRKSHSSFQTHPDSIVYTESVAHFIKTMQSHSLKKLG